MVNHHRIPPYLERCKFAGYRAYLTAE